MLDSDGRPVPTDRHDNAGRRLKVLHLILMLGETNGQYNEHCLPLIGERDLAISTYFVPRRRNAQGVLPKLGPRPGRRWLRRHPCPRAAVGRVAAARRARSPSVAPAPAFARLYRARFVLRLSASRQGVDGRASDDLPSRDLLQSVGVREPAAGAEVARWGSMAGRPECSRHRPGRSRHRGRRHRQAGRAFHRSLRGSSRCGEGSVRHARCVRSERRARR